MSTTMILGAITAGDFLGSTLLQEVGFRREKFFGLVCKDRKKTRISLRNNLLKVEVLNSISSTVSNPFATPAGTGFLMAGPLGFALANKLGEETSTNYDCACYLKDGRKFLAFVGPLGYSALLTEAFTATGNKIEEKPKEEVFKIKPGSIFCMHCGIELPEDAVFCKNCGKKI